MGLGRSGRDGETRHPGEPGVGPAFGPPFAAEDDATRWLFALNRFGIRPGLERIEGLLRDLGHPERNLRILVVAGTNGKGSTTRVLSRLLQVSGHRTLTYTSPHLLRVYERILVDDRPVEAEAFAERVAAIRPLVAKHQASWFETLTALAVQIAAESKVDFLCCETGLGGRLDASNALPAAATLLTTVAMDHESILGSTLPEIAAEKLGLLKRGAPLFCGVHEALRAQVFAAAVRAGSPCHFLDELAVWPDGPGTGGCWDLTLRHGAVPDLPDPGTAALRRNVALALLALDELQRLDGERLLPPDPAQALGNLFLPGRYQTVLRTPDFICDTGHNGQALAGVLAEFTGRPAKGRRFVLFGAMHDKTPTRDDMASLADCEHLIGFPVGLPRSRTGSELAELFRGWGRDPQAWPPAGTADWPACTVAPDATGALAGLAGVLRETDRVLVTGSCFAVAEVMHRLGFTDLDQTRHSVAAPPFLDRCRKESM